MLVECLIGVIALCFFAQAYTWRQSTYIKNKQGHILPGPSCVNAILRLLATSDNFFLMLTSMRKEFGSIHKWWFGHKAVVIVHSADTARKILTNMDLFPKTNMNMKFLDAWVGQSLSSVNGDSWRHQRRLMSPSFSNLDRFYDSFSSVIKRYMCELEKKVGEPIFVRDYTLPFTLDVLGTTVFSYEFGAASSKGSENANARVIQAFDYIQNNVVDALSMALPFVYYLPLPSSQRFHHHMAVADEFVYRVIAERRKYLADTPGAPLNCLVDMIIASNETQHISDTELRDNIMGFFSAGHDTTSSAIQFIIYNLGLHTDQQAKVRNEIDAVCGSEHPTMEMLDKLQHLSCFIKEVMRMHGPIISVFARTPSADTELEGYMIPKGTVVLIVLNSIHHDPAEWDEPYKFKPERFLSTKNNPSYLPFGAGPRVCIGNNFSLMEQKLFLVCLLQKFTIELDPSYKLHTQGMGIVQPQDLKITLTKRDAH